MTKPSSTPNFPPKPSKPTSPKKELVFELNDQEFIELNKLLKLLGLVDSGGEAGMCIIAGEVRVNNEIVREKRKKIKTGFKVEYKNSMIRIV